MQTQLIRPNVPPAVEPIVQRFLVQLAECQDHPALAQRLVEDVLVSHELRALPDGAAIAAQLLFEILHDLQQQGWRLSTQGEQLALDAPLTGGNGSIDPRAAKEQVRRGLVEARNKQLQEPSVTKFIQQLERPRMHNGRMVSVLDLFVAPEAFAADLERCSTEAQAGYTDRLRDAIQPYVQQATADRDAFTNLRLLDIWRYGRYTWSLPLHPLPGRQMFYLIRDAARPFHPIIGIGALGSSVVQITCRDAAIGWDFDALRRRPDRHDYVPVLCAEIDRAIDDLFWQDLVSHDEIAHPTDAVIKRLEAKAHETVPLHRSLERTHTRTLRDAVRSPQYQRKRLLELARLLFAKQVFQQAQAYSADVAEQQTWLFEREAGHKAVRTALRAVKKRHVGTSMMDITTCGALPPYSEVLGGKLVALLMASPQVIADYRARYETAASVIASRMKGEPMTRPAALVLLGTTSLYHVGSSQYHRLHAPVANGRLEYLPVGQTEGYGSVHLSARTYRTLKRFLLQHPHLKQSNVFAAGVNYKLRSIGAALTVLGLDRLKRHATPRLVYLVPLARNWREYLTGRVAEPEYLYNDVLHPEAETQQLIEYWKTRWFVPRVKRPETVCRLKTEHQRVNVGRLLADSELSVQQQMLFDEVTDS